MSRATVGSLLLRARLALLRANPLTLVAAFLLLAVAGGLAWTMHAVLALEAARDARRAQAAHALAAANPAPRAGVAKVAAVMPPVPPPAPAPVAAQDTLAEFYGALGERRSAEQQVKTLFNLAARNGLTLAQGEYKAGYDRNARVYTYQVNLPVKGNYAAIWQFAFGALRAIPFAELDDIGYRRDDVKDAQVEARLRMTFYLTDRAGAAIGGAP
jgi:hypothetical protein